MRKVSRADVGEVESLHRIERMEMSALGGRYHTRQIEYQRVDSYLDVVKDWAGCISMKTPNHVKLVVLGDHCSCICCMRLKYRLHHLLCEQQSTRNPFPSILLFRGIRHLRKHAKTGSMIAWAFFPSRA
jgi:hypothetical protein